MIIDDLTGDAGARTRTLCFDGVEYEIDLTDTSYAELRALLKPYLRAARGSARSGTDAARVRGAAAGRSSSAPVSDSRAIRAWARANDVAVTERGVVPPATRAAWETAGSPR